MKQIILLSLSGVGKSTCIRRLEATGQYRRGITCTTRPLRTGDAADDYDRLTLDEFKARAAAGEMAESTIYNDTAYGILRQRFDDAAYATIPTVWALNDEGLRWFQAIFPDVVSIFLWASALTCRWRMTQRGDAEAEIAKRLRRYDDDVAAGLRNAQHVIDTTRLSPERVAEVVRSEIERGQPDGKTHG